MDPAYLVAAFAGGLLAVGLRLPPLVGFLAAGFVLNALGYPLTSTVEVVADLGVILLLFTIGLKLRVRTLLRPEVWGAATAHMVGSTALLMVAMIALKAVGLALLQDVTWQTVALLGFALSFSSTVFAVKILEGRSDVSSLYGRIAIGVLIMQDVFAVAFLTASTGRLPSPWAVLLLALVPASPWMRRLLERLGHGEMQVLFGVLLALVLGYAAFEAVGIKGDLGALIIGMLLAPSPQAGALSRALFNMKELFLVGFFLSIGLTALPTWELIGIAAVLVLLLPAKSLLYLLVFSRFGLRRRTSLLSTLSLSNFSEFGLIVAVLAASQGWLDDEWLVVLSLALSLSFMIAAPLNSVSERIYRQLGPRLRRLEPRRLHPADQPISPGDAEAIVLGMGRVGRGAYDRLLQGYGMRVLGIDNDAQRVRELARLGYTVEEGDASDSDFWDKLVLAPTVRLVLLAMPHHAGNVFALEQLRNRACRARIAAVVQYGNEVDKLYDLGADAVFHLYGEAGRGLADDAASKLGLTSS